MKPIHILFFICCICIRSNAQSRLSLQAGTGYSSITIPGKTLLKKLTPTAGISYTTGNFRAFQYGVNLYYETYTLGFSGMRATHYSSDGSNVEANAHYLLVAPKVDFRLVKYLHLNLAPSVGFLLSGNEQIHYRSYFSGPPGPPAVFDSSYTTNEQLHRVIFRMAAELQEYIPIAKDWWITVSERATYCIPKSGITDSKVSRNYMLQNANPLYLSLQLGIAHRLVRKLPVAKTE